MNNRNIQGLALLYLALTVAGCSGDKDGNQTTTTVTDTVEPSVSLTIPSHNAAGVAPNNTVNVVFTEAMNSGSITTGSVIVSDPSGAIAGSVTTRGNNVIFTPLTSLTANTKYTAAITRSATDLSGNHLDSDYHFAFTTGTTTDNTAPAISHTVPSNNATDVVTNSAVNLIFSEAMNPVTLNSDTVILSKSGVTISGRVSTNGSTVTFTPNARLAANTQYTLTVTTGAADLAGNALAADYTFSFTTGSLLDTTPPSVSFSDPANNATGVVVNGAINFVFSEPPHPSSVSTASVTLVNNMPITGHKVSGTVSVNNNTVTFTPLDDLDLYSSHTATLTTGIKDMAGNPLAAAYKVNFISAGVPDTTQPDISLVTPLDGAVNVAINASIGAAFTEAMDPATLTNSTFTLTGPAGAITGTVSLNGNYASFTPAASLAYSTDYTATITGAVSDYAGNPMGYDLVWNFTTGNAPDTTAPTVDFNSPADGATAVSIGSSLSALFSEPINTASVTAASFTLSGPGGAVAGNVTVNGNNALFTPSASLAYNTIYTATLTTAVTDLAGNPLATNHAWSFTTANAPDTTAPTVALTLPADNATRVSPGATVTAVLSEAIDCATVNGTSMTLNSSEGAVSGNISCSSTTALFTPSTSLTTNLLHTATLSTGVTDTAGNPLALNHVWSFTTRPFTCQLGTTVNDYANDVASDANGNLYVAGHTLGSLDGNTTAGGYDLFVTKYDNAGTKLWTRQLGTTTNDNGLAVATDSAGNVYVTGQTMGGLDGNINAGGNDLYVVKYDTNGIKQWTRQLGTTLDEFGNDIAVDGIGDIYVTGYTLGALDGNTSAGAIDLFIIKYDSAGTKLWSRQLGTVTNDLGLGITTDSTNNIYVAGYTTGNLDGNTSAGSNDMFVVKYDSIGTRLWTRQLGGTGNDIGYNVASDPSGNIYVAGYTTASFDGNASAGRNDLFVVKYDSTGLKQWSRQFGTTLDETGYNIATDAIGNVYVSGYTSGGLDGNVNAGSIDLFLVKYDNAGTRQWTRQLGTTADDYGYGVATDTTGNVYVAGYTGGSLNGNTSAGVNDLFLVKYTANGVMR